MTKPPLLFVAVLLLLASIASAEIITQTIKSDSSTVTFLDEFDFTNTGQVNISVNRITVEHADNVVVDPSRLGFFLVAEKYESKIYNQSQCALNSSYILLVSRLAELSPASSLSCSVTYPDKYELYFANCAPPYASVSVTVRTELYNLHAGQNRNYLGSHAIIVQDFFFFSIAYIVLLGFWIFACLFNKTYLHRVHLVMTMLLLVKVLSLVCATGDWYDMKMTGTPQTWHVMYYVSGSIKLVLVYTVVFIIMTGVLLTWHNRKIEIYALLIVISLQVVANIISVLNYENRHRFSTSIKNLWCLAIFLLDVFCGVVIILLQWFGEMKKFSGDLKFVPFYIMTVLYTIERFFFDTVSCRNTYQYVYSNRLEEISSLAFFLAMFLTFKPTKNNEYMYVDDENDLENNGL